jgi:glutaconate CoA-transferase subunit A
MQPGSLREVVAQHIHDGQSVALEGFTHLIPFAAGHEDPSPEQA